MQFHISEELMSATKNNIYKQQKTTIPRILSEERPYIVQHHQNEFLTQSTKNQHWNRDQNLAYLQFLMNNGNKMSSVAQRKSNKSFILMAREIQSRNAIQCKTHHQKLLLKYGSMKKIINKLTIILSTKNEALTEAIIVLPTSAQLKISPVQEIKLIQSENEQQNDSIWNIIDKDIWL